MAATGLAAYTSAAFSTVAGLAVAPGATIEVRREDTGNLSALFSDAAGTAPLANPFTADSVGRFVFYTAGVNGGHSVKCTIGAENYTVHNQGVGSAAQFDVSEVIGGFLGSVTKLAARLYLLCKPDKRAADVVCAATIDLSGIDGDHVKVTGATGPVTGITLLDGQEVEVLFTGTPQLNNSGTLALLGGANIAVIANALARFRGYNAGVTQMTDYVNADGSPLAAQLPSLVPGNNKNLTAAYVSASSFSVTADEVMMKNSAGVPKLASTFARQASVTFVGPSGLDTGAEAASTWYYAYAIAKASPQTNVAVTASTSTDRLTHVAHGMKAGTPVIFAGSSAPTPLVFGTLYYIRDVNVDDYKVAATPNGAAIDITAAGSGVTVTEQPALLLSTSASAPSLAGAELVGYSFVNSCDGLAVRNDGSSNLINFTFAARYCAYNQSVIIFEGTGTANAWTSFTASTFFPATAKVARMMTGATTGAESGVSPRSDGHGGSYWLGVGTTAVAAFNSLFSALTETILIQHEAVYASTMYYFSTGATVRQYATGYKT